MCKNIGDAKESPPRAFSTCGFCRNVCLWLAQPPQRFNSGSACLVQLPKCTASCHVLWVLITEVFMRRQTSVSVKNLHQSANDILWMQIKHVLLHCERGNKLHRWTVLMDLMTYQNSPSSSTVMPRFFLSVSPTFDHSSELTNNKQSKWLIQLQITSRYK